MATKEHSLESKKCSADPGEARGCSIKTFVINCQSPDSLTSQYDKRNVDGSLFGWLFVRLVGWWVVVHRDVGMFKSAGSASGMAKQLRSNCKIFAEFDRMTRVTGWLPGPETH